MLRLAPDAALSGARWRADADVAVASLDLFRAVFHRRSGITHLLSEPAPEILAALMDAPLTVSALLAALAERFELADGDIDLLVARLDELQAAGLVERLAD